MSAPLRFLAVAALAALLAAAAAAQETAPETLKTTHGDWQIHCGVDGAAASDCFMIQGVEVEETHQRVLTAVVVKGQEGEAVLRLTVPLGVLLHRGLGLAVDGAGGGELPFLMCLPEGCVTQVALDEATSGAFRAGSEAVVTVHDATDKEVTLPLSLVGFTAAFDTL